MIRLGSPRSVRAWLGEVAHDAGTGLIVVTGPPGAGKSTVAAALAARFDPSVLVAGDAFFDFLATGAIEPWLPESQAQNEVVTEAAAAATGEFVAGGYTTVFDGMVGPVVPADVRGRRRRCRRSHYVMLLPSVERCLDRVATRADHGFDDAGATRKMHGEFAARRDRGRATCSSTRPRASTRWPTSSRPGVADGRFAHSVALNRYSPAYRPPRCAGMAAMSCCVMTAPSPWPRDGGAVHLLDPDWAERLVALAGVRPRRLVLDVGAGLGALTAPLVDAGARVIAVELHPGRARHLRERFGRRGDRRAGRRARPPAAAPSVLGGRQPAVRRHDRAAPAHPPAREPAASARTSSSRSRPRAGGRAGAPGSGRWSRQFASRPTSVPRRAFRPRRRSTRGCS